MCVTCQADQTDISWLTAMGGGQQSVKRCGLCPLAERAQSFGEGTAMAVKIVSVWAEVCVFGGGGFHLLVPLGERGGEEDLSQTNIP